MSVNSAAPFEGGVNGDFVARRLEEFERRLQKMEEQTCKTQYTANSSEWHPRSTSQSARDPINDHDLDVLDEHGNIRDSATISDIDGNKIPLKDMIAQCNDPGPEAPQWVPLDPNDPTVQAASSLRRKEEASMRVKGVKSAHYDSSSSSSTHSSVVSSSDRRMPRPLRKDSSDEEDESKPSKETGFNHSHGTTGSTHQPRRHTGFPTDGQRRRSRRENDVNIKIYLKLSLDPHLRATLNDDYDEKGANVSVSRSRRSAHKPSKRPRYTDFSSPATPETKQTSTVLVQVLCGLDAGGLLGIVVVLIAFAVGLVASSSSRG